MPSTTVNLIAANTIDVTDAADVEFARGAARYLRNAGLSDEDITTSLVAELGIDLTDARRITLTI